MIDDVSLQILSSLHWPATGETSFSSRPTLRKISGKLQIHHSSVKSRYDEMTSTSFLRDIVFHIRNEATPWNRWISELKADPGMIWSIRANLQDLHFIESTHLLSQDPLIPGFLGGHPRESEHSVRAIFEIVGRNTRQLIDSVSRLKELLGAPLDSCRFKQNTFPKDRGDTYSDILKILSKSNPINMKVTRLCDSTGHSFRNVARILDSLVRERQISTRPYYSTSNIPNGLVLTLNLNGIESYRLRSLRKEGALNGHLFSEFILGLNRIFLIYCRNLNELFEVRQLLESEKLATRAYLNYTSIRNHSVYYPHGS